LANSTVNYCEPAVIIDATAFITTAIRDGEARDGGSRGEIFKHLGGGVAVNRQICGTGAVDGHVVRNLKCAAGQQDGTGDTGRVNRVAVTGCGKRVAQ